MIGDLLLSIFNADFLYSVIRITAPILLRHWAVIAEKLVWLTSVSKVL